LKQAISVPLPLKTLNKDITTATCGWDFILQDLSRKGSNRKYDEIYKSELKFEEFI
jgi:hypothetical protein